MSATAAPAAASRVLVPWLERLARLTFAVLIVVLPFRARSPVLAMPPDAVSSVLVDLVIYAVDVLVVATLVPWFLARGLGRRRIDLGPLALRLPALALIGLAWLTIPFGIEPGLSVVGAVRITAGALLALYVLNEVEGLDAIAVPVAAMVSIQAVVGIAQVVGGGPIGLPAILELPLDPSVPGTSVVTAADGSRILRAYGLTPHPNVLGGFLACGLVILTAVSTRSRVARVARAGVIALAAAALLVTFSRGAWLAGLAGLLVGLVIVATLAASAGREAGRPVRRWLATAGLVLGVALAVGWLARDPIASRTLLGPAVVATEQRSIDERLEQIRLGWRIVLERPLTGAGASALPLAMRQAEPDFGFTFYAPHLVALAVAGELGVLGGLAYIALMTAPWILLARARRLWSVELAGASAALAVLTVVSLFDDYPWVGGPGRTLAWFVLGLWAMAWTRAMRDPRATAGPGAVADRADG
ncbi:MAG: O-antigen ligase family protein [Chloroflexi bacterium]|nr:O-antigen ligase family protein [Chloroflexota bacterium]